MSTTTPTTIATLTMTPKQLLNADPETRATAVEVLAEASTAQHDEVLRLELALEAAKREADLRDQAFTVAQAIEAQSPVDPVHGRRPGAVLVRLVNRKEQTVLAVSSFNDRGGEYLVTGTPDAAPGDGDRPEWVHADLFARP